MVLTGWNLECRQEGALGESWGRVGARRETGGRVYGEPLVTLRSLDTVCGATTQF